MQGVPEEQVKGNLEKLKASSREWAERKMRASFILSKIAEKEKVLVTESDVADRLRQMAASRGERPDAVLKRLEKEGGVAALRASLKETKTLGILLTRAKVTEAKESGTAKKA